MKTLAIQDETQTLNNKFGQSKINNDMELFATKRLHPAGITRQKNLFEAL